MFAGPLMLMLAGCDFLSQPSPPLPPLLQDASTIGGTNLLCAEEELREAIGAGSTPETASGSPEIRARLDSAFPVGSEGSALRSYLLAQGFEMHECEPDRSVNIATFRQIGGNGITTYPAFGVIYWKTGADGKIVWTTGDISFTGL